MKPSSIWLVLALALCSPSAKAQHVYRDYDISVSLANYKSFAWAPLTIEDEEAALAKDDATRKLLERAVSETLNEQAGYRFTTSAPDLFIACYLFNKDRDSPCDCPMTKRH